MHTLLFVSDATSLSLVLLAVMFIAVLTLLIFRKPKGQAPKEEDPAGAPKRLPDEPDEQVVVNPTRPNDPEGSILLYRKEGILLFNGTRVPMDKIVDAYVTNVNQNPYLPPAYCIQLNLEDGSNVQIPVGLDGGWGQEALKQLQEAIDRK